MDRQSERPPATFTVEEAADMLGISRATAYSGVRRGEIPSITVGRRMLVPRAALLKLLGIEDERPQKAAV